MAMYAKVRRLRLHCEQPRGWKPLVHALVNFERAGVVNIGRASTEATLDVGSITFEKPDLAEIGEHERNRRPGAGG